jgi:hypothetical protein
MTLNIQTGRTYSFQDKSINQKVQALVGMYGKMDQIPTAASGDTPPKSSRIANHSFKGAARVSFGKQRESFPEPKTTHRRRLTLGEAATVFCPVLLSFAGVIGVPCGAIADRRPASNRIELSWN